ncbi:hypothetical protein [Ferruginibacter profundus]
MARIVAAVDAMLPTGEEAKIGAAKDAMLPTTAELLDKQDLTAVKSMLKAYIFQKDTQARLEQ